MVAPEIRTRRLTLRTLRPGDRTEFVRVYTVSWPVWEAWSTAPDGGQSFDELFHLMLARTAKELRDDTGRLLAAFAPGGTIVGFFAVSNVVRGAFQSAYAGWRVNAEFLRQGYGLEGVNAILDMAFGDLALHRVQANVIPSNVASLVLAERAGFRREGHARQYLKVAGKWQDHVMMAKLAEEHQRQRGGQ